MKILQVTPSYKPAYVYGGPIESVAKLCEGLAAAGHVVHVYTTTANGAAELPVKPNETVLVDGVPVTYFSRITKDHTHISPALWKRLYLDCRGYDIVHIQSWWNVLAVVAALICHLRNVKVVLSPRGMLSDYILTATNSKAKQLIHFFAGKEALRKSYFHATSETEYNECKKLISGWKGFMISNILNLPDIPLQKQSNANFTLLFLSRIHPKKGLEFLLEALTATEGIVLKIAGSGDEVYINNLKQRIKNIGIEHKVEWIGWKERDEKFTELMKADLFVLISHNENFANVVIESLHVGTPVLVSDKVGLASFVESQKLGWVVLLDSKLIAQKLKFIQNQKAELQRIQREGRHVIKRYFSEQYLVERYVEEYEKICNAD